MFGWVRVRGSEVTEAIGMRELLCPIRKCSRWLMEDGSAVEVRIKRIVVVAPMVRLYSRKVIKLGEVVDVREGGRGQTVLKDWQLKIVKVVEKW